MDLHEDAEKNLVTATFEFPGVKKEDVTIDFHNGRLTVGAETKISEERDKNGYAVRERRYGKWSRTLQLPQGVKAEVSGRAIKVTGPKGELTVPVGEGVSVNEEENQIVLERASESPKHKAQHGLTRSLLYNAVVGVTEGFSKTLVIAGVGYRAQLQGQNLGLQVGYSHPVSIEPRDGVTFEVPQPTRVVVRGYDKQLVGQVAADIRKIRKPEPYKGKGVRYAGEHIRRKVGKAGK